jgi:trypsin
MSATTCLRVRGRRLLAFLAALSLIALLASSSQAAYASAATPRVVGGYRPDPAQWPWLAAIDASPTSAPGHSAFARQKCGGTLINPWLVLTAAHCTVDSRSRPLRPGALSVVLGRDDLTASAGAEISVRAVRVFHRFRLSRMRNDVALLLLSDPSAQPTAVFANPQAPLPQGQMLTAMGWGAVVDHAGAGDYPLSRLAVDVPLWSADDCRMYQEADTPYDPASMLCAGYPDGGHDTCQGDSGGPLMIQVAGEWQLVGLVSFGHGCAEPAHPGFYAWVSGPRIFRWINREGLALLRKVT